MGPSGNILLFQPGPVHRLWGNLCLCHGWFQWGAGKNLLRRGRFQTFRGLQGISAPVNGAPPPLPFAWPWCSQGCYSQLLFPLPLPVWHVFAQRCHQRGWRLPLCPAVGLLKPARTGCARRRAAPGLSWPPRSRAPTLLPEPCPQNSRHAGRLCKPEFNGIWRLS